MHTQLKQSRVTGKEREFQSCDAYIEIKRKERQRKRIEKLHDYRRRLRLQSQSSCNNKTRYTNKTNISQETDAINKENQQRKRHNVNISEYTSDENDDDSSFMEIVSAPTGTIIIPRMDNHVVGGDDNHGNTSNEIEKNTTNEKDRHKTKRKNENENKNSNTKHLSDVVVQKHASQQLIPQQRYPKKSQDKQQVNKQIQFELSLQEKGWKKLEQYDRK